MTPAEMEATIVAAGRIPRQRTTTYDNVVRREPPARPAA
jgi:2-iminoacetate synthase ThiH